MKEIVANLIKICFIALQMTEIIPKNKQFLFLVIFFFYTKEMSRCYCLAVNVNVRQHLQTKDVKILRS